MKKEIYTVCLDCGKKYDKKQKGLMGVWTGACDICGKKNISCASAPHDFGIYSSKEIEANDRMQDAI